MSAALGQILDAHLPNPALVLDRWWDIIDRNSATDLLLKDAPLTCSTPRSMPCGFLCIPKDSLHASATSANGARISSVRSRLELSARATRVLRALADEVTAYPGDALGTPGAGDVVIPLILTTQRGDLSFFSISAAVESALDVTVDELRIETFYPADEATARHLNRRVPGGRSGGEGARYCAYCNSHDDQGQRNSCRRSVSL